jgi:hypothetical protein
MKAHERRSRGFAFGEAARDYEAVRPGYPASLMPAVIRRAALDRQSTMARFPRVQLRTETFEQADPAPESFDLVFAATAFHWIDPAIR